MLEIAPRHEGAQTMRFDFHELALSNLAANKPVHFRTLARIPTPSADLQTYGTFGPLKRGDVAATALSGSFQLRQGDLSSYKMIGGIFTAAGRFKGTLGRVELAGTTQIPNFEVTSARHPLALSAEYETIVNGTSGDVTIASAAVHFLDSTLSAQGSISGRHGKTVSLDVDTRAGRVQDLLRLFVSSDKPPLKGVINFHAHVVLPPIHERFLKKVRLDGEFDITGGEFVKPGSQRKVDELSARASGKKALIKTMGGPPRVSSEWKATVRLRDAVARMSNATFAVPGAVSRGSGTYDLPRQAINLAGHLVMDASLSKAASGVKSLLLIPLDPFFKKRGAGAVVPVRVMGTYSHPRFKASLREHN
ncbi:MAG TPA: AsmA-like C-terminal region-containing protein [Bryobacteraceae bacterium]